MRIGIIDSDLLDNGTNFPNLVCMKISAFYKQDISNEVNLILDYDTVDTYDKVFLSKVFTKTVVPEHILSNPKVEYGGTGFFYENAPKLPYEIEHFTPDYNLYRQYAEENKSKIRLNAYKDYTQANIGFTTRGCFRKCPFCVNKVYDRVVPASPVEEFYNESNKFTILLDDNFLGYSGWESILNTLKDTKKPFRFQQGLDIRLLTHHKAEALSSSKYSGDMIFAFDNIADKDIIVPKLDLWRTYASMSTKLYTLVRFYSQDINDVVSMFERIRLLMERSCLPYIMRYCDYENSKYKRLYNNVARWCNQPQFFKKLSFREFCMKDQAYQEEKQGRKTLCSSYKSLVELEKEYPEIAKKYFDLKYATIGG